MFDNKIIGVSSSTYENYGYVISDHQAIVPVGKHSFD